MADGMELKGFEKVQRALERLAARIPDVVGSALYEECQVEATESQRRTPVDTGTLRGSHHVSRPQYRGRDISVTITVGGPAAPYAVHVHEDLEAHHNVGQAKFLESTVMESRPYMAGRVARRVDLRRAL